MSKVDWSLAPEGTTHYSPACEEYNACWCKFVGGKLYGWLKDGDTQWDHLPSQQVNQDKMDDLIERPKQPQAWSGPEDGLPPIGTVCEHQKLAGIISGDAEWIEVKILAHVTDDARISPVAVYMPCNGHTPCVRQAIAECFKPKRAAEQIAHEKRESAIRELMDIAQVDCRVTAARLVDAGFKREVV